MCLSLALDTGLVRLDRILVSDYLVLSSDTVSNIGVVIDNSFLLDKYLTTLYLSRSNHSFLLIVQNRLVTLLS